MQTNRCVVAHGALKIFAVVTLLSHLVCAQVPHARKPAPLQIKTKEAQLIARLEQRLPELMKDGDVPGLAVALIRKGQIVWQRGFGVKNVKTNEPVTDDTVFEAASLSKPVFAYAVLKLVDAGKFDLDKPLNKYLPGNYDVGDDPRLGEITARRVLSHTTGFPNWRNGPLKIYLAPGTRFSYSGEGFVYLSKVIEHVTGESFNDFMTRLVFAPLGMTSSSYVWRASYDTSKTFRHNARGQAVSQNKPAVGAANAASSLHTTAHDYGRFVVAMLQGAGLQGAGLKPSTRQAMLTPQTQVIAGGANSLNNPRPQPLPDLAWGLGWGLQTMPDGLSFWHWGDNGDSKAYVVAFVKEKLGVVYFANSASGLSIARELISAAVGGAQPALDWLRYESYNSPGRMLFKNILARGAAAALIDYRAWRQGRPASETINENQMNRLGYDLIGALRLADAVEVFKQNIADFPQSANGWDSLGEAYARQGERALAIEHYERALELDPANASASEALKKLREKQ